MTQDPASTPRDGDIERGADTPDLPTSIPSFQSPVVLESAMATGEDDGTPGERGPIDPDDETAIAVADDAPSLRESGGSQGDGLEPQFAEPTD